MGCSCTQQNVTIEYDDISQLKVIISNYIQLQKQIHKMNENIENNLYLIETDYFKKICENLNINLNDDKSLYFNRPDHYLIELNKKIGSPKVRIIENKNDLNSENIEILTENILNKLCMRNKLDKDKIITCNKLSDEIREIIFKDNSKIKISIKNEKTPFIIIVDDKNNIYNKNNENKDSDKQHPFEKNLIMRESNIICNKNTKENTNEKENNSQKLQLNNDKREIIYNKNKEDNNFKEKHLESIKLNLGKTDIVYNKINEENNLDEQNSFKLKINNGKKENYNIGNIFKMFENSLTISDNGNYINEEKCYSLISSDINNLTSIINQKLNNSFLKGNAILKQEKICNDFYNIYKELFIDLNKINYLMTKPLDSKNLNKDYVIINKMGYNKLMKLFESKSKFNQEMYIIDSFEKLTSINNIDFNNLNIEKRKEKYLKKDSFFKLDIKKIKHTTIKYPDNFILIKKDLLLKFKFEEKLFGEKECENNIFNIIFGGNYLFIEIQNKNSKEIVICSRKNFFFNTNIVIVCLKNNYFEKIVEPDIKVNFSFYNFFDRIGFDITKKSQFRHIIDETIASDIYIINYKIVEKETVTNKILKSIIFSLYNITELKEFFGKNGIKETDSDVTSLFIKFIHDFQFKNENWMKYINDVEKIIEDFRTHDKLEDTFKDIMEFILNSIHEKINQKKILDRDYKMEGNDKHFVCKFLKNKYNNQNESIIKNLFYGIFLTTIVPNCCGEKLYKSEISKYIYLTFEDIKNYDDLKDILDNWGITKDNNFFCKACFLDTEAKKKQGLVEYPKILIIILNDENEKNKKPITFPPELDVSIFSFKYKLLSVISTKTQDYDFQILKYDNNNCFVVDKNQKKIEQKQINIYSKYPRVIFYEKINDSEKKRELSDSEIQIENCFNETIKSKTIKMNGTRIKNSMEYQNEESSNRNYEYEIFNRNNFKINKNEIHLIQNKNSYENSLISDDNQNLINLNYPCDKPILKEDIEKFGDVKNFLNNNYYNNKNNIDLCSDRNSIYNDGKNTNFNEEIFPNNFKEYNIGNNIQLNNINNNIFNNNINNNIKNYNIQYNPINPSNNNYPDIKYSYYNDTDSNKYQKPQFSYINSSNSSIIQKEIHLKFNFDGNGYTLVINDINKAFIDIIKMLKNQIPYVNMDKCIFLCNGKTININKTIKENHLRDGDIIAIVKFDE